MLVYLLEGFVLCAVILPVVILLNNMLSVTTKLSKTTELIRYHYKTISNLNTINMKKKLYKENFGLS